ncbi:MAG: prepilin-type N-terminal cleavage/methylation domain-containing protein [Deltaproteobacteria bacterium]|nr:prepilin-type N-terminal cleavage/methylation domain-containing protein [Deltaproteobacteria bacterium]
MIIITNKNQGFTFIEIIAVIVLIAIISAITFSRLIFSNTDLIAQTEVVKTQLRYAQSKSMNSDVIWGIKCDGSSYWLYRNGDTNDKVLLPGEDSDTVNLADKGIDSMDNFTLSFDDRGIPHTDASTTDGQELTASDPEALITLSSGGVSRTITLTPNTGFIP